MPTTQTQHETFLRRAVELATHNVAAGLGGPFGAVIVRDGKIIAEAANSVTTTHDPTAHAEVNAIRAACRALGAFTLTGATLYTSCEPCPMCLAATYWAHIEAVYFGNTQQDAAHAGFDDAFLYTEFRKPAEQRRLSMTHLNIPESILSFEAWQTSPARIDY